MQYVDFGRTGLRVSRLGFGGIPVQRIDEPGTRAMLKAAHEAGINYIDTARAYTVSEEWIGQALEELGLRDEFILATKCRALTKAEMEAELAASLKNLRTDHIDLYQFHNPSPENLDKILAPGGAMEALLEAKAKGVVGHIGITAHLSQTFENALKVDEIETIMFPYNIVEQQGKELIDRCAEKGKAFIDMKPLAGGAIEDGRLALRYVLSNPAVTVSIPGMAAPEELEQNVAGSANTAPLDPGGESRLPESAGYPWHPVLPPLQLLCPLHGGHPDSQLFLVPWLPGALWPCGLGTRTVRYPDGESRCLHWLWQVRDPLPV